MQVTIQLTRMAPNELMFFFYFASEKFEFEAYMYLDW